MLELRVYPTNVGSIQSAISGVSDKIMEMEVSMNIVFHKSVTLSGTAISHNMKCKFNVKVLLWTLLPMATLYGTDSAGYITCITVLFLLCLFFLVTGGPMDLGDIEDIGGRISIVCPWHGYSFNLEDGSSPTGLQVRKFNCEGERIIFCLCVVFGIKNRFILQQDIHCSRRI